MPRLPWFEDFNDRAAVAVTAVEESPAETDPPPDPRAEAWNEGFLAGYRAGGADSVRQSQAVAAELTRRVAAIENALAAAADRSAATMGGLLLDVLGSALPPEWPADRLAEIVAAIRPIFALEPLLHVSPAVAGEVSFRDLPALYRAMEAGEWELAVRWHQPGADIDQAGALRGAIETVPFASDGA